MIRLLSLTILILFFPFHFQPDTSTEIDEFWSEISRSVIEGDFEGYAAVYHEDAVLVRGTSGESYPISEALAGWKQGFMDTKAGSMTASVEFRFSKRIHDEATTHETGIYCYTWQPEGEEQQSSYMHFQALLVKKNGEWKMLMEYQMEEATEEEWGALE